MVETVLGGAVTTIIESMDTDRPRRVHATIDIAGVAWPAYKVWAVIAAAIAALVAVVLTGSGEITMWACALTLTTVWWAARLLLAPTHP